MKMATIPKSPEKGIIGFLDLTTGHGYSKLHLMSAHNLLLLSLRLLREHPRYHDSDASAAAGYEIK